MSDQRDIPAWIRPARRLSWATEDTSPEHRQQAIDTFGADWRGPDLYLEGADAPEDEDMPIVHVHYVRP